MHSWNYIKLNSRKKSVEHHPLWIIHSPINVTEIVFYFTTFHWIHEKKLISAIKASVLLFLYQCIVGRELPHLSHKRCDFTNESCRTCHLQRQVWSDPRAVTTLYFVIWKKLLFVMELPSNKLIKYNSIICHKRFFIPKPFFDKGCDIW